MKRNKSDHQIGIGIKRWRWSHALFALTGFYLIFIFVKFQTFMEVASLISSDDSLISLNGVGLDVRVQSTVKNSGNAGDSDGSLLGSVANVKEEDGSFHRKLEDSLYWKARSAQSSRLLPRSSNNGYGRISGAIMRTMNQTSGLSELEKMAVEAWTLGLKAWEEAVTLSSNDSAAAPVAEFNQTTLEGRSDSCPLFVSMNGEELREAGNLMILPCGLAAGSSITLVGFPRSAHEEYVVLPGGVSMVWVSQFALELRGLKAVDGEDPPRILHVNPRLRGDWSKRPVIEHNTCYRMQWGTAQRCDGMQSTGEDDTVDGFVKCEKWVRDDAVDSKESKTTWWLKRFIGRAKKPAMTWPFPFKENRLFVLTVRAGVEGYHINVGGRHITSFPYRTGFALDDATGLSVTGDVDLHSMFATSLPLSHPSFSLQHVLEMSEQWRSPPLHGGPVYLCIGILSSANHFAERMAIRKSWMQSDDIRSSKVVARFFVALNARKHVNLLLKKEAEYFGDIIILPFIDRYELVVLKTIAICEYGVHNLSAAYIMKCDDDTFVRVDSVLKEVHGAALDRPLYMGNLNLLHKPLRGGKWAVTFEEWPEEVYPPYANGPGYVISSGIARYIASKHANHSLRLFKMEDVSMGLWVQEFNSSSTVQYSHSWKFCQYGCMDDYYTAHYQSPRQMMCLWDKLKRGKASCCNFR